MVIEMTYRMTNEPCGYEYQAVNVTERGGLGRLRYGLFVLQPGRRLTLEV